MPVSSMKELLEAGVHFGHHTRKWNPKMKAYIYGERNDIYIIDLHKTRKKLEEAYEQVRQRAFNGDVFLFVGTKKQAQDAIKESAEACGQHFVNSRWLGGMLTNWTTIQTRIDRLNQLDQMAENGTFEKLTKKEVARLSEERDKLQAILGGMRNMGKLPDVLFIVDCKKEHIAIQEAHRLEIPIVAVVDTNCDPDEVHYVIPGNDDAIRAVKLMTSQMAEAINEGRGLAQSAREQAAGGVSEMGAVHIGEGGRIEYSGVPQMELPPVEKREDDFSMDGITFESSAVAEARETPASEVDHIENVGGMIGGTESPARIENAGDRQDGGADRAVEGLPSEPSQPGDSIHDVAMNIGGPGPAGQ